MDSDRKWFLAWARFDAFRAHVPRVLDEVAVEEFHSVVSALSEASGVDLATFRIPPEQMKQIVVSLRLPGIRRPGHVNMSDKKYCDEAFMTRQIDGILLYFQSMERPPKQDEDGILTRVLITYLTLAISAHLSRLADSRINNLRIFSTVQKADPHLGHHKCDHQRLRPSHPCRLEFRPNASTQPKYAAPR